MSVKVSVIVPVFNTEDYLAECLEQLIHQTLKDIEIILTVDEASCDSSLDICREYEEKYPEKVKVIVHPNGLPGDSRNYGIDAAQGEYIGFVDSDDLPAFDMYELMYHSAVSEDADVACCEIEYLYTNGVSKIRKIDATSGVTAREEPSILGKSTCYVWNKIYRRRLIESYGFRMPNGRWYEDSSIIYNIMLVANKIVLIHKPLYQYKVRREGSTANVSDKRIFEVLLATQDIVDFFKSQNAFEGEMRLEAFRLCHIHIDVRFDFLANSDDLSLKRRFINAAFDFYDRTFPNWEKYQSLPDPLVQAAKYAKMNRKFALAYYASKSSSTSNKYTKFNLTSKVCKTTNVQKYIYYLDKKINPKAIMYEAYEGTGMNCNTYALFLEIFKRSSFKKFTHIWSVASVELAEKLSNEWENFSNVSFVVRDSEPFFKALATSKYLINNNTFPGYFVKRDEQVYVTSWHAITVKTLGYDYERGKIDSWNQVRNYLATDWFVAANKFMQNNLETAYKMKNIFEGRVVVEGYPRNNFFIEPNTERIRKLFQQYGIKLENKKIVLYAPTWKGAKVRNPVIDLQAMVDEVNDLERTINTNEYQVLVKPHHVVFRNLPESEKRSGKYVPSDVETNELLSMVDILISDYSSIFIDFMCTKRPVLFYMPDQDDYDNYRGTYFTVDQLPGPMADNMKQIGKYINNIRQVQTDYAQKYQEFYEEMFSGIDEENIPKRIVDCILCGKYKKYHTQVLKDNKVKILLYPGDLRKSEVRRNTQCFLSGINYKMFDVTMVAEFHSNPQVEPFLLSLNKNVRLLCSSGTPPRTESEIKALNKFKLKQQLHKKDKRFLCKMFAREFRRRFGNAKFNATINLEPQNRYYHCLFSFAKNAVYIPWAAAEAGSASKQESIFSSKCGEVFDFKPRYAAAPIRLASAPNNVQALKIEHFQSEDIQAELLNVQKITVGENRYYNLLGATPVQDLYPVYHIPVAPDGAFVFACFTPYKNRALRDQVLYVFKRLVDEGHNVALYLICNVKINDLVKLRNKLELEDRVFIIGSGNSILAESFVELSDCVLELPVKKDKFDPTHVRWAQVRKKPAIVPDFAPFTQMEECNGVYKTPVTVMHLYDTIKRLLESRDDITVDFDVNAHNQRINKKLLKAIKKPVPLEIYNFEDWKNAKAKAYRQWKANSRKHNLKRLKKLINFAKRLVRFLKKKIQKPLFNTK